MEGLVALLQYLGITPDRLVPVAIIAAVCLWVGRQYVQKALMPMKKDIGKLTRAIVEMQTIFSQNGVPLNHHVTETTGSPLRPTEYGVRLIQESGLEAILNERQTFLKEALAKRLGDKKTEYDVQEEARALLLNLKDDVMMDPVKSYAYETGMNIDFILRTGGLWLRDDYLGIPRKVEEGVLA